MKTARLLPSLRSEEEPAIPAGEVRSQRSEVSRRGETQCTGTRPELDIAHIDRKSTIPRLEASIGERWGKGFLVLLVLPLIALASGCKRDGEQEELTRAQAKPASVSVVVDTARIGLLALTTDATGQVQAWREVSLVAQGSGPIIRAPEKEGTFVRRGEIVYEIDPASYKLAVEEARLKLQKAETEYAFELGSRQADMTEKIQEMLKITTGLKEAQLGLARARQSLENAVVAAPFDCYVAELSARTGGIAYSGDKLCKLVDTSMLKVIISVGEEDAAALEEGASAWVSFPGLGDEERRGAVYSVSPIVSTETRGCTIEIAMSETQGIKPGMYARVRVQVDEVSDAVMVPQDAILIRSERPMLFVVRNGKAKWEYVKLGAKGHDVVQVLEGVRPGELVLVEGHLAMAHDTPIVAVAR